LSAYRDYYVHIEGTGMYDKLTHTGIYGMDCTLDAVEDLLDIDINYYVKVNFTSVIGIVDALGGIDVYSDYTIYSPTLDFTVQGALLIT
jgi:anionic cell wall polymer biosynthesis LytR-Cps2A-Psr (LCP) family protein